MRPVLLLLALSACGTSEEATRISLDLVADGRSVADSFTTDLGYEVTLSTARLALADIELTVAGEIHTSWTHRVTNWLVRPAFAHPGHLTAGEITGELQGRFVVDWLAGDRAVLGPATLLTGEYSAANFTFVRAETGDGVAASDPLTGHTALFAGEAAGAAGTVQFLLTIDSPEDRELVGAPFVANVAETTRAAIGLCFTPVDRLEGDTFLDGIDFVALDEDQDGTVILAEDNVPAAVVDAYLLARRAFQTHDHFELRLIQEVAP
jgi:hypothetical protein